MKREILLSIALMFATSTMATIVDGVRQAPEPTTTAWKTGNENSTYYLYNTSAKMFFTQGNTWGTRGCVGPYSSAVKMYFSETGNGTYYLNNYVCMRSTSYLWKKTCAEANGDAVYVDQSISWGRPEWKVVHTSGNGFRLQTTSSLKNISGEQNYYMGRDDNVTQDFSNAYSGFADDWLRFPVSVELTEGNGHHIEWALVSPSDYEALGAAANIFTKAQELKALIDKIKELGGNASAVETVYLDESSTADQLEAAITDANVMYVTALIETASDKENVDVTSLLVNPAYENGTSGWTVTRANGGSVVVAGTTTNKCFEAWNNEKFDIYQIVRNAPQGVYEIEVQGFYRYLRDNNAWNAFKSQANDYVKKGGAPVYVYMNNNKTPFVNVFDEPVDYGDLYTTDATLLYPAALMPFEDGDGHWYPNEMYNSALAFSVGMYKQSAFGLVAQEGDSLQLGVTGASNQGNDSWVIWDNFKLKYRGFKADVIKPVLEQAIADINVYVNMLMGKTEYASMTTALNAAQQAIENNDGTAMFQALNALYDVKSAVQASKDIFSENEVSASIKLLEDTIPTFAEAKLSKVTLANANALLEGLKSNSIYENSNVSQIAVDVNAHINALVRSVAYYETLKDAINSLEAVMDMKAFQDVLDEASTLLTNTTTGYNEGLTNDDDIANKVSELNSMTERVRTSAAEYEIWEMRQKTIVSNEEWQLLIQANETLKCWTFDNDERITADLEGVVVADAHVVSINLADKNISGCFPYPLLSLPFLNSIDLSGNGLTGTLEQELDEYIQTTGTTSSQVKNLNISNNNLSGNIGAFATFFPQLEVLDASSNHFSDVVPMIPATVSVELSGQSLPLLGNLYLSDMSPEKIAQTFPSIIFYNHEMQEYDTNISIVCTQVSPELVSDDSWFIVLDYVDGEISIPILSEQNVYNGQNGDVLYMETYEGTTFSMRLFFDEGDANFDGQIDVLDLQTDINYIFEKYKERAFNFTAANLWNDNQINVQDVVKLVDLLMEQDADTSEQSLARREKTMVEDIDAWLLCEDGKIYIESSRPVASFDITIKGCSTFLADEALRNRGMTCRVKRLADGIRVIGYMLTGESLGENMALIGAVDRANATITRTLLSDMDARLVKSCVASGVTAIQSPKNKESKERYRLSVGAGRSIVIDANGTKTIQKDLTK